MFACSSDNQSFKGRDFEAVEMMRKDGLAIDNSPEDSYARIRGRLSQYSKERSHLVV
jgi:hypothetical protein